MKAKTSKFLAVIAVLAIAFAGVAVLVQGQTNDADTVDATTAATYDSDYKNGIVKIALENAADKKAVALYDPAVGITAGDAYYFNEDATVEVPDITWNVDRFIFFILNGVTITFVADSDDATKAWTQSNGFQFINVASEENGVITLDAPRDGSETGMAKFDESGYAGVPVSAAGWSYDLRDEFKSYGAIDLHLAVGDEDKSIVAIADSTYPNKIIWGTTEIMNLLSDSVIKGEIDRVNILETDVEVTFINFTGTIANARESPASTIIAKNFTGKITNVDPSDYGFEYESVLAISGYTSGSFTSAVGLIGMLDGAKAVFEYGSTIEPATTFVYIDKYNDIHSFTVTGDKAITVGMDGFNVSTGDYKIELDGTVTLGAATDYVFTGNATIKGMVYSKGFAFSLENKTADPKDSTKTIPADIKLKTFQVSDSETTPGKVTLKSSVLVETGCSFYVSGALELSAGAILKIAEGSVVKPEGDLTLDTTSAIWNAGQFIAKDYKNGQYDKLLIRVYMSTSYQTGTFYQGASVYDGTMDMSTSQGAAQTPLTVAFGSYIDMTGIDKVNLTSGGIDVNSGLYKYRTLILATYNNTIALTAAFDNQYPVTVALDGKSASVPVMTAKSATISNVVWDSPISATIYVTAPEVYTVVLAKEVKLSEGVYVVDTDKEDPVWTSGLTIKDQDGRVIPISSEDGKEGYIEVVFGYQYTIEGANSTSNYKFIAPNKDLPTLSKDGKTTGSFTMIRNNIYKDENGGEIPVVLQVTEGLAVELTVNLIDDNNKYAEGDVFMYYAVADDEGEPIGDGTAVNVQIDGRDKFGVITGIYSNDTIFFKSEFAKFFRSVAIAEDAENIVFPTDDNDTPDDTTDDEPVDVVLSSEEFEQGFTFTGITKTENEASFTLVCEPDTIEVEFVFGTETDTKQMIIVEFSEYCGIADVHDQTFSKKKSQITPTQDTPEKYAFTINMCVGEVFNVTWTERENFLSKMTTSDGVDEPNPETDTEYTYGTDVTVEDDMDCVYTLTEDELKYVTVENQTDLDLTLSIGKFSAEIASKKSNSKVIVNDGDNTLILSKKGYTIQGWDFSITRVDATAAEPTIYVSGPQTTQTFDNYNETDEIAKITIINVDADMTRYFVNVLKDDHGAIDPFDQNGYMGDERKAYVTTQYGYTVTDVLYEYQEVDMTEKAVGHAVKGYTPEGAEVWTYTMPASNVLLKPIIYKDTRTLSFVDQNEEQIAESITVVPMTEIDMAVPCKPLYKIVEVTTVPEIEGFNYDSETGYMTFTMPDEDVKVIVTCEEIDYSEKLLVTVGQEKNGADINVVLYALDGKAIGPGEVTIEVWYTYINEFGDVSVDYVDVTLTYEANDQTVAVLTDDTFIDLLGENYNGAYAITGEYIFGTVEGELSTTEYKPVEA